MNKQNIPMRRCVGCYTSYPKENLTRYVLRGDVTVIDLKGTMDGRGIYVCKDNPECLKKARKKGKIVDGE